MPPISYQIQAQVVDLKTDNPRQADRFLVDTNVWYWLTYPRCQQYRGGPKKYQARDYPNYIKRARKIKAQLFTCGLCFSELADLIEESELDIFRQAKGRIEPKEFRHSEPEQRSVVTSSIQDAWAMVKSFAEFLEIRLDLTLADRTCQALQAIAIGPHDFYMVESARLAGITQIITDDGDLATVPDIIIFTANNSVICKGPQLFGQSFCLNPAARGREWSCFWRTWAGVNVRPCPWRLEDFGVQVSILTRRRGRVQTTRKRVRLELGQQPPFTAPGHHPRPACRSVPVRPGLRYHHQQPGLC